MSKLLIKARRFEEDFRERMGNDNRPVFHFSNLVGWMNDPNGFSEYKGEHHLFFQYYPYETKWNDIHWGHAKSQDFVKWEYLPAALAPDQTYDNFGVFSGSAIEDGETQVLIYTGVEEKILENGEKKTIQNQCIAVGDGINYEKVSSNPVITGNLLPEGSSVEDFRDPKMWKQDDRYYAVTGSRSNDGSGQIALFYSDDLYNWKFGSILDQSKNMLGKMWECPDFFSLDGQHILMISPQEMEAVELEFHNGNNGAFLVGDYDKEKMCFERKSVQNIDYGLDFYAPQTMLTEDGRRVMIGWMQSWDNPMYPAEQKWSGMMTFPRELYWKEQKVYQMPVRELENYRTNEVTHENILLKEDISLSGIQGRSVELLMQIKSEEYGKCRIKLASDGAHYSEIIYDYEDSILTFDRTHSGLKRDCISTRSMRAESREGVLKLRILVDLYSIEIFVNDGEKVMTSLIYTQRDADEISFSGNGKTRLDITKYDIDVKRTSGIHS